MVEATAPRRGRRVLVVGMLLAFCVVMSGTTLPAALWGELQIGYRFGTLTQTIVFAGFAMSVVVALVAVGPLSDRYGRRPLLLVAVGLAVLSAALFLAHRELPMLIAARILSGLSGGVMSSTASAAIVELVPEARRALASTLATVANMLGLGLGPVLGGVLGSVGDPLVLPFVAHLALLVPSLAAVLALPQRARTEGVAVLLAPRALTPFTGLFLAAFAAAASLGLFTSVGPQLFHSLVGDTSMAIVGGVTAMVFVASVAAQLLTRASPALPSMLLGLATLTAGALMLLLTAVGSALATLFLAVVAIGAGQGLIVRAAMAVITARADRRHLGSTVSAFFVVLYVGMGLPALAIGLLAERIGLSAAIAPFAGGVLVLCLAALAVLRPRRGAAA